MIWYDDDECVKNIVLYYGRDVSFITSISCPSTQPGIIEFVRQAICGHGNNNYSLNNTCTLVEIA